MSKEAVFVLIDGHALIYRAFFAFPPLTSPDGILVNAVYGFTRILLTVIRDLDPTYIVVTFDLPKPTFRHTEFVGYKAQRKEMPVELQGQITIVKEVVEALNIPILAVEGYEADDVIGTIATQITAEHDGELKTIIVTGDKDSFQLVNEHVHIWMPASAQKNHPQEYAAADVAAKMGVGPEHITDFKALAGDPSDNIPGVKGIGGKTAVKLIQEFGSVEEMYKEIEKKSDKVLQSSTLKGATLKKIVEGYESAVMSKKLATIDTKVPIRAELEECRLASYDKDQASKLFEKLGFKSLITLLPLDDFESGVQSALF